MGSSAYQNPTISINQNVGNVTESYNNVYNNCAISDEKRQILEWLSRMAPRDRHQAVREGRMNGVGNWLLGTSEFEKWHVSEDQAVDPVLFCYGDPGVGKTYLSSLVIDTLCNAFDGENVVVACIYCDFYEHKEQSATGVLAALLKQLVAGVQTIPEEITKAFERANRKVDGLALLLPEIYKMFIKSTSSLRRGFICIDALDEFPTKHRPELWDSLQRIVRTCPNIRLFITGRPHIREEVKKYFPGYPDLSPITPTEEEIRGYVAMRLKKDPESDAMDPQLEADILRIIPDKISGTFLLVSLIMDAILEDATIHQRRQTLHKMTNGFGLDDAYSTTLDRIRGQRGNRVKLGMESLMWISCSAHPLKAEELRHALAVEVGTTDLNINNAPSIRTLLSCTLGLVTIDEQSSIVRLVHFTLQEYLAAHGNLFATPHSMMSEICLTYLKFQSVCELSTASGSIPSTMPFLHYSSCYWGFHARKDVTEHVKLLALQHLQRDANHISAHILLSERAVDFLSWNDRYYGRHPDLQGYTGLHCIAYMGIAEIAVAMVDMKVWDLNQRDSKGATPLLWAAKYGNSALAKQLLDQGDVDPTLSDERRMTPLTHAAKVGHLAVVKLLLQRGDVNPDSRDRYRQTPLSYAAESGHEDIVKILLERGDVNPDSYDRIGLTPLSLAAESGHVGIVKMLLERDVNPNSKCKGGLTPLFHAAKSGHESVVKILLERLDLNPNLSNWGRQTPLSVAAEYGHEGVVKLLLERGDINPDLSGGDGRTPLSIAARYGQERVVKILLERRDVNPDSPDRDGRTPLSFAAESGHEGILNTLLGRGDVNPDSSDASGQKPADYAQRFGHSGVMSLLSEHRPTVRKPPQPSAPTLEIPSPTPIGQEEVEPGPVSQQGDIIPNINLEVTEVTPLSPPAQLPLSQLNAPPPASVLVPILTSHAATNSAIIKPSRPKKHSITAIRKLLHRIKRKLFPSSS